MFYTNFLNRYVGKFIKKSERILLSPDAKYTNLYIKNLDHDITVEHLTEKFSEFGKIASLAISKDVNGASKGFGFVCFENPDDAKQAQEAMDGTQLGKSCAVNDVNMSYSNVLFTAAPFKHYMGA